MQHIPVWGEGAGPPGKVNKNHRDENMMKKKTTVTLVSQHITEAQLATVNTLQRKNIVHCRLAVLKLTRKLWRGAGRLGNSKGIYSSSTEAVAHS